MPGIESIAIIGAGPAGAAAAVQLRRHGLDPLVFEKDQPGGLARHANLIENYPGYPGGIRGVDLARLIGEHLEKFGVRIIAEEVLSLDYGDGLFILESRSGASKAESLILASGTVPERNSGVKVSGEADERVRYGLDNISTGADTVIIGAGDAAFDYALNPASGDNVLILGRSGSPRALPVLAERAESRQHVHYCPNTEAVEIEREGSGLIIRIEPPPAASIPEPFLMDRRSLIRSDYLIFAIGRKPADRFMTDRLADELAELERRQRFFAAGDLSNGGCRQVAAAAGDGLKAAIALAERIRSEA